MITLECLLEVLHPLAGKTILDAGCGPGHLARSLMSRGAHVTRVDPSAEMLQRARLTAPSASFECAVAEALPFGDRSFDAVIFHNSLHHVASGSMGRALDEAARVTASGGHVIVVEPLPEGSFFEAFRCIDDESLVRKQAQVALQAALATGRLRHVSSRTVIRVETFSLFEDFIARATAADPSLQKIISARRTNIEAGFLNNSSKQAGGYRLEQPLKCDVMQPR